MNLSTIVSIASGVSALNVTMASRRLRNSGLKTRSSAVFALPAAVRPRAIVVAPAGASRRSRCPARSSRASRRSTSGSARRSGNRPCGRCCPSASRGPSPAAGCCRCRGAPSRFRRAARRCTDACARRRQAARPARTRRTRRRANQPRHGVLLHVLAHVEADELVAQQKRQLLGELRLADAGRPREQETAGGPLGLRQPGARSLDRLRDGMDGLVLPEHDAPQRLLERAQPLAVRRRRLLVGNASRARRDALDVAGVDDRAAGVEPTVSAAAPRPGSGAA